ncbi:Dabb family protein [Erwinia endophytica]|uniref:Dabb family protein n=1 Tax=Erwinia endophytica TaxID=1563158 RepID=UPI001265FDE2|nr:Dabb family protein [Erwinia endophytica]KAB8312337.1 Dabb family protein [Erwinia endophytica]
MIRHVLFITFTERARSSEIERVRKAFLQIPDQVDGVLSVEWGCNDSPEGKNAGFTHCVLMTFRDEIARQRYLPHPAHEAIKAIFQPVLSDIIVFDFTVMKKDVYPG